LALLALLALVSGYTYSVQVYNGSNCTAMGGVIGTGTAVLDNNNSCSAVSWMGPNNTMITGFLDIQCDASTNGERVYYYDLSMTYSNCSFMMNQGYSSNQSVAVCQNFNNRMDVSFMLTSTGGIDGCAGLKNLEAILGKIFCISGDTVLATPEGSVQAKDLEIGTPILTAQGDFKPVQVFWHRTPETSSCLRVCSKANQGCVVVSDEHMIRSSTGFAAANTLSTAEFSVSPATCDGLVSFYVEGGAFVTQEGGVEVSCFSKTWGMGHEALLWFTEWSGVLSLPINDWTFFAETSRCMSKGVVACMFGSLSKLW